MPGMSVPDTASESASPYKPLTCVLTSTKLSDCCVLTVGVLCDLGMEVLKSYHQQRERHYSSHSFQCQGQDCTVQLGFSNQDRVV